MSAKIFKKSCLCQKVSEQSPLWTQHFLCLSLPSIIFYLNVHWLPFPLDSTSFKNAAFSNIYLCIFQWGNIYTDSYIFMKMIIIQWHIKDSLRNYILKSAFGKKKIVNRLEGKTITLAPKISFWKRKF